MTADPRKTWQGVFPAVTTQFRPDFSVDLEATGRTIAGLLRDGVSGLIMCGTVGENTALTRNEKVAGVESPTAFTLKVCRPRPTR